MLSLTRSTLMMSLLVSVASLVVTTSLSLRNCLIRSRLDPDINNNNNNHQFTHYYIII